MQVHHIKIKGVSELVMRFRWQKKTIEPEVIQLTIVNLNQSIFSYRQIIMVKKIYLAIFLPLLIYCASAGPLQKSLSIFNIVKVCILFVSYFSIFHKNLIIFFSVCKRSMFIIRNEGRFLLGR